MRIGHGYDVHKLVDGRKLIIGGCDISFSKGLLGHSDADVLVHAIMDSILGAAGERDIGHFFPDTSVKFKNANSLDLLKIVCNIITEKNFSISNVDCTIIAQKPKLSEYILKMRENVANVCSIPIDRINIKATTEEGLGFSGNLEGIAAHAVALLNED